MPTVGTPAILPDQTAPATPPTLPPNTKPDVGADVGIAQDPGAGALSAANSLLFGVPSFIYRRLGGDEAYKNYVAQHKAGWEGGNVAGTIGNALISGPVSGALKGVGLGAEALEGADVAAQGSKLFPLIAKGAVQGGLTGGAYGVTGSNPGQEVQGFAQGAIPGAILGGTTSGVIGKIAKDAARAPQILEETANSADAQVAKDIFGVTPKALKKSMNSNPLTQGSGLTEARVNEQYQKIADLQRSGIAGDPLDVKMILQEQGPYWQTAEEKYTQAMDTAKQASISDPSNILPPGLLQQSASDLKALPEVQSYMKFMANQGRGAEAEGAIKDLLSGADSTDSLSGAKSYLDTQTGSLKRAMFNGDPDAYSKGLLGSAAYSIRHKIASDALAMAGAPRAINEIYSAAAPIKQAMVNDAVNPKSLLGTNSTTFLSGAFNSIASGAGGIAGGPLGALLTHGAAQIAQKVGSGAVNRTIGELAAGVRPLTEQLMPAAEGLANSGIPGAIGSAALPASRLAGALGSQYVNGEDQSPPAMPSNPATFVQPGQAGIIESDPVNMQRINSGIDLEWYNQTKGLYGPPGDDNPTYQQFKQGAMWALHDNGQSKVINPRLAANVMFQDPKQKENYLKTAEAQEKLQTAFPVADRTLGPVGSIAGGLFHPEASAARGDILKAAGEATGGGKEMESAVNRILRAPGSQAGKFQKIMSLIRTANPAGAQDLALGQGVGNGV
jgi:hypothetical protein